MHMYPWMTTLGWMAPNMSPFWIMSRTDSLMSQHMTLISPLLMSKAACAAPRPELASGVNTPLMFGCAWTAVRTPLLALSMFWLVATPATTFTFGQLAAMRSLNERTRTSWFSWPGFSVTITSPLPPMALQMASAAL